MDPVVAVRYLHFISIFAVVSCLVSQHLIIESQLSRKTIKRLWVIDAVYGAGAIVAVLAGLALWFWVGKPAEYYSKNWILHTKVGLFAVVGVLSLIPTRFFRSNKKGELSEMVSVPHYIKTIIRVELAVLFILPLLAALMANGKGYFG